MAGGGATSLSVAWTAICLVLQQLWESCCRRRRSARNDTFEYFVGYPFEPWEDLDGSFYWGIRRRG